MQDHMKRLWSLLPWSSVCFKCTADCTIAPSVRQYGCTGLVNAIQLFDCLFDLVNAIQLLDCLFDVVKASPLLDRLFDLVKWSAQGRWKLREELPSSIVTTCLIWSDRLLV
jgi:hypothetical protein